MDPKMFFASLALVPNWRAAHVQDLAVTDLDDGFRFEGYAANYDSPTTFEVPGIGTVGEEIAPGAFDRALASGNNIPFTVEHNPEKMLATTRAGTLRLDASGKGLHVQADVPDTSLGRDVYKQVKRGDLHGMSFGFVAGRSGFTFERRNGTPFRRLHNFKKLLDVCVTWDPTYRDTEAQFRSLALKYADSPELMQQLFLGAYPQLEQPGLSPGADTEEEAAVPDEDPEGAHPDGDEDDNSGVVEQRSSLSVAARRRRLALYLHEHGGGLDDAS